MPGQTNKRPPDDLVTTILDDLKDQHGITTNYALAQVLKVHEIYITRWYKGQYGNTAMRVLAPHLVAYGQRSPVAA